MHSQTFIQASQKPFECNQNRGVFRSLIYGERILGFLRDNSANRIIWWLKMQLDLVFVGLSLRAQSDWAQLCEKHNARPWFFDTLEEIESRNFSNLEVLMVSFEGHNAFLELHRQYMIDREDALSVAILPHADYALCGDAFRAGANDVIAMPVSPTEFDLLMKRLIALVVRTLHPEAIRSLSTIEKSAIRSALRACNGQVSKTSRKLGIGRSTLYRKLEYHGLVERT